MMRALRTLLVAVYIGCALVPVRADAEATALHAVVYAVEINGVQVSAGAIVLASSADDVYVRIDDLRAWRLVVPTGIARTDRDANAYVPLRALPAVDASVDATTQTLSLRAGPTAFRTTAVVLDEQRVLTTLRPAGAYADYAFAATGGGGANGLAAEVDTGLAAFGGVVRNDIGWTPGVLSRLQTSWERDDSRRMQAIVLGDTTTLDTKTAAALRFAGIRWASDFSEQPEFSTFPGVDLRGAATVPSALDVYVNDVLAVRRDIAAGPYALSDLPLFDGAGTLQVRSVDAVGRMQEFSVPYYVSRELLKPGLAAFSYSAGLLDEDGLYGPFIVDAARRWGISTALTAGARVQHGADRTVVGADTDWSAGHSGIISLAAAAGRSAAGTGMLWDTGYDYSGRRLTVGAELKVASAGFASLDPTALPIGREVNVHAALRLTRATLAQVSLVRDATVAGPISLWSAGVSGSRGGIPYSLTAYRSAGAAADGFGLTCIWSVPVGRRATLSSHVGTGSDSAQSQIEYSGSTAAHSTTAAWDLAAGVTRGSASSARLDASNSVGDIDVDAFSSGGFSAYTARASGSIATIGGKVSAARQITGSFGLIRVPGFPGVDVYVNARYAGKTDARGDLMTADLIPFVENEVRIDPSRLALSTSVDALTRTVVPTAGGGTTIVFAVHRQTDVRLSLRFPNGRPLPPGTLVRGADGVQTWPVGLDGHVDLIGVVPGGVTLAAATGASLCHVRLTVPATGGVTTLPAAICR